MLLFLTALTGPLVYAVAGLLALGLPGRRTLTPRIVETAAAVGFVAAILVGVLHWRGHAVPDALLLVDPVTAVLSGLIAFIGLVVIRYSAVSLRDEAGRDRFLGWMALTLAAVLLLVQAGTLWLFFLAWLAMGLGLQRLLLFYPARPRAQLAARKHRLISHAADASLAAAFIALGFAFGTVEIAAIADAAGTSAAPTVLALSAGLIALAAILKSAQFPFQGWLTEVMEAPTPVSALLHAGVVNAGGFLLIRFSGVMVEAPGVLAALVAIGGFSALVGGLVMLTQPAVKTALAWSTVAQMGFMIMQCGLGLFAFALLHIVAHALYKAHAFLSSGGAVEKVAATARPGPVAVPSLRAVALSFLAALVVFAAVATLFGAWSKPPQAVALGLILVFGVAYMFAQGLADAAPAALMRRAIGYAAVMTVAYFTLQQAATLVAGTAVPPVPAAGALEWMLILLALASFAAAAFAQAMFPHWAAHPALAGLRVHLQNGLYANLAFDLALRAHAAPKEIRP